MSDINASERWVEAGYNLFVKEGPDGLQVERLARILRLNKSGFYHYFGDMENYTARMIKYHYRAFDQFMDDVAKCNNVDPEYIHVIYKHKVMAMGQMQLARNKDNPMFLGAHKEGDERVVAQTRGIWAEYLNLNDKLELAGQFHALLRDIFYTRITWETFTIEYLRTLAEEVRDIVAKMGTENGGLMTKGGELSPARRQQI
ncbi:MAG TPA: TetR/AcrR family transcriptional regulator [Cyclobacteriaceae bacterium]|nr:TetR/AcrR family transcriptional regulator [Cyclobacteriaceae bacterium]